MTSFGINVEFILLLNAVISRLWSCSYSRLCVSLRETQFKNVFISLLIVFLEKKHTISNKLLFSEFVAQRVSAVGKSYPSVQTVLQSVILL